MAGKSDRNVTVAELIEMLRNGSLSARQSAAGLLGRCGRSALPAVPALVDALQEDGALARLAAAALGDIGPDAAAALPALGAAARFGKPELRRRAILALGDIGGAEESLLRALTDVDDTVRRAASLAIGVILRAA
jgi:HEAT repeat protein